MNSGIPAATLILFRDGAAGAEHLFVERAASMAFAAGAVVFPGGRVDPGDHALASRYPALDGDDAAARVAAIRETLEEAGLAIGMKGAVDGAGLRAALGAGADFGALIDAAGITLDLDALTPFARWCPNLSETRTFDTRFYVALAPHDSSEASVDATENVHLFWSTPRHVLDQADRKQLKIIFPTRRNLERLSKIDGFGALQAHLARYPVQMVTPWIEERGGVPHLCIPDHIGYPFCAEPLESVRRG